jgi:hypothetical protein
MATSSRRTCQVFELILIFRCMDLKMEAARKRKEFKTNEIQPAKALAETKLTRQLHGERERAKVMPPAKRKVPAATDMRVVSAKARGKTAYRSMSQRSTTSAIRPIIPVTRISALRCRCLGLGTHRSERILPSPRTLPQRR